jgi:hypothetical protein
MSRMRTELQLHFSGMNEREYRNSKKIDDGNAGDDVVASVL